MLVIICHSETELEAGTIWQGTQSSCLSTNGREIAEELAQYNRVVANRAYAGPSEHTIEFAKIILDREFVVVPEFVDRSMGSLTGRTYRETMIEFPRRNWLAWQRSYWSAPPDGESLFDISDRVLSAFRSKVLPVAANEVVAVVCSRDIVRLLLGFLGKIEEVDLPHFVVQPGIPYVINDDLE